MSAMTKEKPITSWSNKDNTDLLEDITIDTFKNYVEIGGFADDRDIDLIMPFLKKASSIAELGAGYGRVIKALRERDFKGNITAIERSNNFFTYLTENFSKTAKLINKDILDITPPRAFDAVLYMWCNISEWPPHQQASIVGRLASWTKPGGLLIIETMCPTQAPLNAGGYTNQTYIVENKNGKNAHGYIPTYKEIEDYIELNNLNIIKRIDYITSTNRKRAIYFIHCP